MKKQTELKEERMNLKELRDNLNKLSEVFLENTKLMLDIAVSEECSGEFGLMTVWGDDNIKEDCDRFKMYKTKQFKDLQKRFIKPINKDLKQAKIREGEKGYDEEYNICGEN